MAVDATVSEPSVRNARRERAHARRVRAHARRVLSGTLALGFVLAGAAIAWWSAYAPRTSSDAISSMIVNDGEQAWDGALVMPIMVSAAAIAAALAALVALPNWWTRGAAAVGAMVAGLAAVVFIGSAIDAVAGELFTLGVEHITAVPLVPHALGTWALLVTAATTVVAVLAVLAPDAELRVNDRAFDVAFRGCARLAIVAGFGLVAVLLWRDTYGSTEARGFAVFTLLAGVWLAGWLWTLVRFR